jgi:hypothetical protein
MITIVSMSMVVHPAGSVIKEVSPHDQDNRGYQQPELNMEEKLLQDQQPDAHSEEDHRPETVVVAFISMVE